MNALLSRSVLDAISFFIGTSPGGTESESRLNGPLAPYPLIVVRAGGDAPGHWVYPEFLQDAAQPPELVTQFGRRALSAYWS